MTDPTAAAFVAAFSDSHTAHDVAPSLTCVEAEALADVLRAYGAPGAADQWIEAHATADEEGDMHYEEEK